MHRINYAKIFEDSLNEIYVFAADTLRFVQVNRGARDNLGYSLEELQALTPLDLKQDLTREQFDAIIAPLRSGEKEMVIFETTHTRRNGSKYGVEVHLQLSPHEGGDLFVAIILDITRRRQLEQAMMQSEERYRMLVEHSQHAITLHAPDGRFIYANPTYIELMGYPLHELLDMRGEDLQTLVHPDDLPRTRDQAHQQVVRGQVVTNLEYRALRKDGTYVWVESLATPIFDEHGRVAQLLQSKHDITERKLAQARTFEVEVEKARLRLLGQFIAEAAHEFRTPLSVIGMNAYLAGRVTDAEERQRKIAQIERQVDNITRLVDSLLRIVKTESSDSAARVPVRVAEVVQSCVEDIRRRYAGGPIIDYGGTSHDAHVLAPPDALHDALWELFDNACRFSGPRGEVVVSIDSAPDAVIVAICDDGPGIAEEDMPHIFEMFWRKDQAHTTSGFGLGLPTAERIIHLLNGHIELTSAVGAGTRIQVTLPLLQADVVPMPGQTHQTYSLLHEGS